MTAKLLFGALFLLVLVQGSHRCPDGFFKYGPRCYMTCDHAFFDDCPDTFSHPAIPVCVLSGDDTTTTEVFGCDLCSNPETVGISFGPCQPPRPPRPFKCKPWEMEVDGECVDKCDSIVCEEGYECRKGKCKKERD